MSTNTINELAALLQDKDRGIRAGAVKQLGDTYDPDAVPGLITALKDQDAEIRISAAAALRELSEIGLMDPHAMPAAVPALIDALKDQDAQVRSSASAALGGG